MLNINYHETLLSLDSFDEKMFQKNEHIFAHTEIISLVQKVLSSRSRVSLVKSEYGAPSVIVWNNDGCDTVPVSISHRFPYVFVVANIAKSQNAIGCDVEKIQKFSDLLKEAFLTERELEYLKGCDVSGSDYVATKLWAVKEAYLKACGVGLRCSPKSIDVLDIIHCNQGEQGYVKHEEVSVYCFIHRSERINQHFLVSLSIVSK